MNLFSRHTKSAILLIPYIILWIYVFYWFISGSAAYPHTCGAANGGLVMLALFITTLYFVVLLTLVIANKGQKQKDYLIFLGIVLLPIVSIIFLFFYH